MTAVECGLGSGKWEVGTWGLADWELGLGVRRRRQCTSPGELLQCCCLLLCVGEGAQVAGGAPPAAVARVWSRVSMGVGEWRATVLPACVAWPLLAFIFHVTVSD